MLRKVQEDIIAPNPEYVEEISKGMRRVLEQKKHVFFASSQLIEQDCDLTMLPRKYFQQQMVIIIRKKFSAASIINRVLQMMRERGLLQRLALKWHLEGRFRGVSCAGHPASPLGLRETYTAFFMLAAGVGAALSLLMAEIIMNNFEKFRRFLQ
ncbi:hypothetical protein FHG87_008891 [Trinorchestia longiramus]|nr:hypothetical protein FHG87_008891 [Trinorchestia longiramus]